MQAQTDSTWDVTDYSDFPSEARFLGEYPQQDTNLNFPKFSWDKIPRWVAVRNAYTYTQAQIDTLAHNYQLIMFEKANKAGFSTIEEGIIDASKRVKAVNPDIKTLFYWNTRLGYDGYAADTEYKANEWEWTQHTFDVSGNEILFLHKNYIYWYNHEVEAMRNWWFNIALGMARQPEIDGIFLDKSYGDTPFLYDSNGTPIDNYSDMLIRLNDSIPENKLIIGNTLRNERDNGNRAMMEIEDGSYLERWAFFNRAFTQSEADAIVTSIQLMREALMKGKIINLQSDPGYTTDLPEPTTRAEKMVFMQEYVHFPLAVFLIIAEKNAYFSYNMGVNTASNSQEVWDASFIKEFGYYLGEPLGEPTKNGYVYKRSYDNLDLTVNVSTKETSFIWKNKISATQIMPTLEPGSAWYHNYYPLESNAIAINSFAGSLSTSEPSPTTIMNPSARVSKFVRASGLSYIILNLPGDLVDISTAKFKIRVYASSEDSSSNNTLKLVLRKDELEATQLSLTKEIEAYDKWVEYSFDLSEDSLKEECYNNICLFFASPDANNAAEGNVYYIDALQGPKKPYLLTFRVKDTLADSLLKNISVFAGQKEKKTDANGEVQFSLAGGMQSFRITHPDYFEFVSSLEVSKDTVVQIALTPEKKRVIFKIISESINNPLSNISATLGVLEGTTGINGTAIFDVYKGHYDYSISHPDYFTNRASLEVENDTAIQLILLEKKADIKFRIYAEDKPVYNVSLKIDGDSLTTNQTGIVLFKDLTRFEEYTWSASKEGYEDMVGALSLNSDTTLNINMTLATIIEDHVLKSLKLYPNPSLSLFIIESEERLSRIEICDLSGALLKYILVNDSKATFNMSGYPNGVYLARVYRDGLRTLNLKVIKSDK